VHYLRFIVIRRFAGNVFLVRRFGVVSMEKKPPLVDVTFPRLPSVSHEFQNNPTISAFPFRLGVQKESKLLF
jgi:hypothetical protein